MSSSSGATDPAAASSPAGRLLARQLKEMKTAKDLPGISVGLVRESNIFEWEVMLMINDDCKYYGGSSIPSFPPSFSPTPFPRPSAPHFSPL